MSIVSGLLVAACATSAPPAADARISLREGCGYITSCISYDLTLLGNGDYALRKPGGFVKAGKLGPEAFARARKALDAANFEALPDRLSRTDGKNDPDTGRPYPCMPDSPVAEIAWQSTRGADEKVVQYNKGCPSAVGQAMLDGLHEAIGLDELVKQ